MSVACSLARLRLPARGGEAMGGRLGEHIATCLACQAEQARYRSLRRRLRAMEGEVEPAPSEVAATVAGRIGRPLRAVPGPSPAAAYPVTRTTMAAAAGAAVVAAAVIVGIRRGRAA